MLIQSHFTGDSAALIPSRKWREKGLTYVAFGGTTVWTATQGLSPASVMAGTVKRYGSPYGEACGFGSTYGAGSTDRLDTTAKLLRPTTGWRSWFCNFMAVGSGGGSGGRICHPVGDTSMQTGEVLLLQFTAVSYIMGASTQFGRWDGSTWTSGKWHAFGGVHDQRSINVNPQFYFDGSSASINLQQPAVGAYGTSPIAMSFGNRSTDNARNFNGQIGLVMFFDGALSAADHAELAKNPYQVFTPDELFVWLPDAGGASVSLTGNEGTSSAGVVAPSISTSTTGVSATSAAGSLSPSTGATATLEGTASTIAAGALPPTVSCAVTGSQCSTTAGTLTEGVSKDIAGVAATSSVGTLSPSAGATASISGAASATATGALAATLSITLGGTSATASVGTLALPGSYSAALGANQTTTSAGAATPSVSKSIVGAQSTTSVGSLSAVTGASAALSGVQTTSAAGAPSKSVALAIAGCQSTTFAGALGKISSVSGQEAITSVGTMNASTEPFVVTEVLAARTLFVKPKRSTDITVRERQKSVTVMWS